MTSCSECNPACTSAATCSPWEYVDSNGNAITGSSSITHKPAAQCDIAKFETFVNSRKQWIIDVFDQAVDQQSMADATNLYYDQIENNEVYSACKQEFMGFYTLGSKELLIRGTTSCPDYGDQAQAQCESGKPCYSPLEKQDPCCNHALRWSDCCLPRDLKKEVHNQFDGANDNTINERCSTNATEVTRM